MMGSFYEGWDTEDKVTIYGVLMKDIHREGLQTHYYCNWY